jgi:hypothetical protein
MPGSHRMGVGLWTTADDARWMVRTVVVGRRANATAVCHRCDHDKLMIGSVARAHRDEVVSGCVRCGAARCLFCRWYRCECESPLHRRRTNEPDTSGQGCSQGNAGNGRRGNAVSSMESIVCGGSDERRQMRTHTETAIGVESELPRQQTHRSMQARSHECSKYSTIGMMSAGLTEW